MSASGVRPSGRQPVAQPAAAPASPSPASFITSRRVVTASPRGADGGPRRHAAARRLKRSEAEGGAELEAARRPDQSCLASSIEIGFRSRTKPSSPAAILSRLNRLNTSAERLKLLVAEQLEDLLQPQVDLERTCGLSPNIAPEQDVARAEAVAGVDDEERHAGTDGQQARTPGSPAADRRCRWRPPDAARRPHSARTAARRCSGNRS